MTGFGDPSPKPRYVIEWEEYGNATPNKAYRATLIFLPKGIEGEDEEKVGSDVGIRTGILQQRMELIRANHWTNVRTAHYRKEFPLEGEGNVVRP